MVTECFFLLVLGGFSDLINQNNFNSNWKNILGFRNMQEKLENNRILQELPFLGKMAMNRIIMNRMLNFLKVPHFVVIFIIAIK